MQDPLMCTPFPRAEALRLRGGGRKVAGKRNGKEEKDKSMQSFESLLHQQEGTHNICVCVCVCVCVRARL